jgi:hypothetical protein
VELACLDCKMVGAGLADGGYLGYGSYDGDRCSSLALGLDLVLGQDYREVSVHAEDVRLD